ncbi:hypothetical protein SNE40_019531 [Patella caerulea]|uniref:Uncharacterized protein n=1 Tax=Patella caerulea TaxID=87958 RepID=A0AAN8P9R5_PATCE
MLFILTFLCVTFHWVYGNNFTAIPCTVEGKTYQHGEAFKIQYSGPCIEYTCNMGGYGPSKFECDDGNKKCSPVGSMRTIHQCIHQQCVKSNSGVGYNTLSGGCLFNDRCLKVGEIVEDRCFVYQCKEKEMGSHISYSIELISEGCYSRPSKPYNCISINTTVKEGCIARKCEKKNNMYSLQVLDNESGCKDGTLCRPVGLTWTDKCEKKVCVKDTPLPGYTRLQIQRSNKQCEDVSGICHPIGAKFLKIMNGKLYHNCTCSLVFNVIFYTCNSTLSTV